ncbi:MAG: Gfo/Idh/MocA family protein [Caldicoprobacterales bacterium]|jgi:predicted dehydrogenase
MKKYAIVGAGGRGIYMYAIPMVRDYSDVAKLVGVYDANVKRSQLLVKEAGSDAKVYEDFDELLKDAKPDTVIVTTVDRYHHEYIVRAMDAGCDVIVEKPLTIDIPQCKEIFEAEKRNNKKVIVTFNVRFAPFSTRLREIVRQGTIGDVYSVHFEWLLDTSHGADYFRRWHRRKENSGGLLVHKSTHHFDLINWIIGEKPVTVNAFGTRRFYGPTREERGVRCRTCDYKETCEFYLDISKDERVKKLYLDCEDVDGYYRDRCVFSEDIDIEDTVSVSVKYSGGTVMSYSLTAHSPYEGYRLVINGSKGRIEVDNIHGSVGPYKGERIQKIKVFNRKEEEITIKAPIVTKGHGGGDERLLKMLFCGIKEEHKEFVAGSEEGANSILIGIAANRSIKEGRSIQIQELLDEMK